MNAQVALHFLSVQAGACNWAQAQVA